MPPRSKVHALPDAVREALHQRLIENGFGGYEDLSAWLDGQGFEISKSALHRYGTDFEARVDKLRYATEQAKAIVEAAPDDEGAVNDALIRMLQEKYFHALQEIEIDPSKLKLKEIGLAIARISRASVAQKKWMAEVRDELERKKAQAIGEAEVIGREHGLDDEGWAKMRAKFLGVGIAP